MHLLLLIGMIILTEAHPPLRSDDRFLVSIPLGECIPAFMEYALSHLIETRRLKSQGRTFNGSFLNDTKTKKTI